MCLGVIGKLMPITPIEITFYRPNQTHAHNLVNKKRMSKPINITLWRNVKLPKTIERRSYGSHKCESI